MYRCDRLDPRRSRLFAVWFALVALGFFARSAAAHPTPGSVAQLDFTVEGARIEQDVPLEELERALHQELVRPGESAEAAVRRNQKQLSEYAAEHVSLRALADRGEPLATARSAPGPEAVAATSASFDAATLWPLRSLDVGGHAADDGPRARFQFVFAAPSGQSARSVRLHDDLVTHEVVTHYTCVYVRSDWSQGMAHGEPALVGVIHAGPKDLTLTREGSFGRGLRSMIALGMDHIASGTDHLLFLLSLVLVAPVTATRGAWRERRTTQGSLLGIARIVTAFTLGHSATLALSALGALGGFQLPSAAVEAAIALSILITATHALRPLFPRREALVAGAFGLVHGLAFATILAGRDLGPTQTVWTLLGFNTGIELAQLGLLALVLPWLLMLARTPAYAGVRVIGASLTAILALGWLIERTTPLPNPARAPLAWLEAHPFPLLLALVVLTILARFFGGRGSKLDSPGAVLTHR